MPLVIRRNRTAKSKLLSSALSGCIADQVVQRQNQVAIVRASALEPVVQLLRDGSSGAKEEAGRALNNLAANDENEVAIVRARALWSHWCSCCAIGPRAPRRRRPAR